jgi:hypothetical protein
MVIAALGAVAPSAAQAATAPTLLVGPVALGHQGPFPGDEMVLEATTGPHGATLVIELSRIAGTSLQEQSFLFRLPRSAIRVRGGLVSATLDTRSALRRFGRIRMGFSCRRSSGACTGSRRNRTGTLAGSLDLRIGAGFRIRERSLPATLKFAKIRHPGGANPGTGSCTQNPGAQALTVTRGQGLVTFIATKQGLGPASVVVIVRRTQAPASELGIMSSTGPGSALSLNGLQRASISAAGVPFIRGSLKFTRTGPLPGCRSRGAIGAVSGSLSAHFDFLGTVRALTAQQSPRAILVNEPRARSIL